MKTYKVVVDDQGTRWYDDKGRLHRENDLPAIEYKKGDKEWCFNGRTHRETGPAIECTNGDRYWYLDGKSYPEHDFNAEMAKRKAAKQASCNGKLVEIDGRKYELKEVSK